jgi:hypothetical protein
MLILSFVGWLENHQSPCLYKKFLGIECPGCGLQTSFIALLKGNVSESIAIFPALMPMIAMMIYLLLFLIFKFKNGLLILKILFIFTSSLIAIGYIVKIVSFLNK